MAHTRSSAKSLRVAIRRRTRNKPVKSSLKTYTSKATTSIASGAPEDARLAVIRASSVIDKAATKGVIHRNNAARRKSRLMKKLNQVLGS